VIGTFERAQFLYGFGLRSRPFELVGAAILRYGLVLFLVLFGLAKFTDVEAQTIYPWVANSPVLGWLYAVASRQAASNALGVVDIALGVLLAVRPRWPRASVIGSLGAVLAFLTTLSFLFTTPGLTPEVQGFLMKDLLLVGAAVWTAGDALRAAERRRA
jgi:uncharacterized membrane protein YkgB